jgi:HEAT repeat protein
MAVCSLSRTSDSRLAQFLEDEDAFIRTVAVQGLGASGDPAVIPALQKLLEDRDGGVRSNVCHELFQLGAIDDMLIGTLEELMADPVAQELEFLTLEMRRDAEMIPELAEEEGWGRRQTLRELLASARERLSAASTDGRSG